jgi:ubiquitin C-terminal hydrolase
MEGDNAYLCEHLGKRVSAVKRTGIRTLPQMLCVHLKRFEFDYHNQTRHKLRDRCVGAWVREAAASCA